MSREKLHQLIDELPEELVGEAQRFFDYLQIRAKSQRTRQQLFANNESGASNAPPPAKS